MNSTLSLPYARRFCMDAGTLTGSGVIGFGTLIARRKPMILRKRAYATITATSNASNKSTSQAAVVEESELGICQFVK